MKDKVIEYLKSMNNGKTPTEIGLALGKPYNSASSSVSPALKYLVKCGLATRQIIDRKVLYSWKRK
jgi:hypothetical protein